MYIIEIQGLEKRHGHFHLSPFDLKVEPGSILTVLGHERAGKTTLLRLLWGLDSPDSGWVRIFNTKPTEDPILFRESAGYASQLDWYYPELTTEALLEFVGGFYQNWEQHYALEVLKELGVSNWHEIGEIGDAGRRMLGVAAALGHRPPVLILDEPAAGLDPKARKNFIAFIRKLSRSQVTTIVVSSDSSDDLDGIGDGTLMLSHGLVQEVTC
ncbi:MAG TPA: ABC transporter ATP-binding protein [Terriglobia bacterium]|jgi:ABC-2 type transport system ATP-binding protein